MLLHKALEGLFSVSWYVPRTSSLLDSSLGELFFEYYSHMHDTVVCLTHNFGF